MVFVNKIMTTEEKILLAARKIFFIKGYDGAKMQDIANDAEINKAMLHYYFRNKEQLYEKVNLSFANALIPQINDLVDMELNIFETIENFVGIYLDFLQKNPDLPSYFVGEMNRNQEMFFKVLEKNANLPNLIAFSKKVQIAIDNQEIRAIHPIHLFLNIISLCIFPYISAPMIEYATKPIQIDMNTIFTNRKKEITSFIILSLTNQNNI